MKKTTVAISAVSVGATLLALALSCLPPLTLDHIGPFCGNGLIEYDVGEECEPNGSAIGCSSDCKVTCEGYKDEASLHCYYLSPQRARTVFSARGVCKDSNLVHLGSQDEHDVVMRNLRTVADGGVIPAFYVALQEQASGVKTTAARWEPLVAGVAGWSMTCPGCYEGVVTLASAQPDAGDGGCACENALQCASSSSGGGIAPVGCVAEKSMTVVCERNPSGTHITQCKDAGGTCIALASTHAKKRYVLVPQQVSPGAVKETCSQLGGTPAIFDTTLEREEIAEAVSELGGSAYSFWIGLTMIGAGENKHWIWADGMVGRDPNRPDGVDGGASRPSVFADGVEARSATEGMRALITVTTGQPLIDNGLAHAQPASVAGEPPVEKASVLCQIP